MQGYAPCRGYWIKKLDALSIRIPTQWPQKLKPSRQLRRPKRRSPRRALLRGYGRPTGGGSGDTTNGRSFNLPQSGHSRIRNPATHDGNRASTLFFVNGIAHILRSIPYKKVQRAKVKLPKRSDKGEYDDQASLKGRNFILEKQ